MSANSLVTKEETAKQRNVSKVLRISPGKPLPTWPIAYYERKGMGGISEDLVSLWGSCKKKRFAGLSKIERESVYRF